VDELVYGVYEDNVGALYKVVGMGDLKGGISPHETIASVTIYHRLHVDHDGGTLVMAAVEFQRHFRKLSPPVGVREPGDNRD
jgi:hypothetical protein